ncbi:MAG: hypothetical protein WCC86_11500 [Methanoregula sp.]
MMLRLVLGPAILLVLILAVAGCTQPVGLSPVPSPVSPTMTPFLAPVQTQTIDSVTPGPTGVMPDYWAVEAQAQSNGQAINPKIIVTFRGGMGMDLIQGLNIKVTRSDGVVETGQMIQPLSVGESLTFDATTGYQDRAEVWAISPQGDEVKILDQYVAFRSYNT